MTEQATRDPVVLTHVPVQALAQPLIDFFAANGVAAFSYEDDTHLDATRGVEIRVAAADEARAQELLADYWATNEAKGDEM